MPEERLQKLIARSGMCSRRDAEELIREGRVTVNGRVAGLGERADLERDHVKIDGKALRRSEPLRYFLLYKPREVMTTCDDPEERTTVLDLVRPHCRERVFPVGRLDYHSEGLILLTNDGELAERVTHPKHGLVREYLVKIRGDLDDASLRKLRAGTVIEGRRVRPRSARRVSASRGGSNSWWCVEVTEGRTHEVRELFFRVGHPVQRLRRTAIGPLRDDRLRPGDFRPLTEEELQALSLGRPIRPPRQSRSPRSNAARRGERGSGVRAARSGDAPSSGSKRAGRGSRTTS
jgi:23S rRNA pseudouridine2605 synthase